VKASGAFLSFNIQTKNWLKQQLQYDLWQAEQHQSEFHVRQLVALV
jgi:plasmid maintenance system antidote protein VapI